jgi:hypothetical protein
MKRILIACLLLVGCGSLRPARDIDLQIQESETQAKLAIIRQDWPALEKALDPFQARSESIIGPSEHFSRYMELLRNEGKLAFDAERTKNSTKYETEYEKFREEKELLVKLLLVDVQKAQIAARERAALLSALAGRGGSPPPIPNFQNPAPIYMGPNPHEVIMRCGSRGRTADFVTGNCM